MSMEQHSHVEMGDDDVYASRPTSRHATAATTRKNFLGSAFSATGKSASVCVWAKAIPLC